MRALQVVVAVAIAGCVSAPPSPAAQPVRITSNRDVVKDCEPLGHVDARDDVSSRHTPDRTLAQAELNKLRAVAARVGANVLLLSDEPVGMNKAPMELQRGEAYNCGRPE